MPGDYREDWLVTFAPFLWEAMYYAVRLRRVRMKSLLLKGVRIVAGIVVVWSTFSNFLNLSMSFGGLAPREAGELEVYERLFAPIRSVLFKERYDGRNLGYVSVHTSLGQVVDLDGVRFSQLRYVAIPFIVLSASSDAPYVIGDYMGQDRVVPPTLDGFVKIYDQGLGLVLYKKVAP
jgi:hypothetical protein